MKTGFRYSLDIPLVDGKERWAVEHMLQQAFEDPRFLEHGGNKVTLNTASSPSAQCSRHRSCASCAPAFIITTPTCKGRQCA